MKGAVHGCNGTTSDEPASGWGVHRLGSDAFIARSSRSLECLLEIESRHAESDKWRHRGFRRGVQCTPELHLPVHADQLLQRDDDQPVPAVDVPAAVLVRYRHPPDAQYVTLACQPT